MGCDLGDYFCCSPAGSAGLRKAETAEWVLRAPLFDTEVLGHSLACLPCCGMGERVAMWDVGCPLATCLPYSRGSDHSCSSVCACCSSEVLDLPKPEVAAVEKHGQRTAYAVVLADKQDPLARCDQTCVCLCGGAGGCEDWLMRLLVGLELRVGIFLRTFCLFYLLAVCHLFVRGAPLCRRAPRMNYCISKTRGSLRGAPVLVAFFAVAHLLPRACAVKNAETGEVNEALSVAHAERPGCDNGRTHVMPCATAQPADGAVVPASGVGDAGRLEEDSDEPSLIVGVYRYQRSVHFMQVEYMQGDGADALVSLAAEDFAIQPSEFRVLPVFPQPDVGFVTLVAERPWVLEQLGIPLLIEVGAGSKVRFVEVFFGRITREDIIAACGPLWIQDFEVFLGNSARCVSQDAIIMAQPGTLVRVLPASQAGPVPQELDDKLQDRQLWFASSWDQLDQADLDPSAAIGILGYAGNWRTLPSELGFDVDGLMQAIFCGHHGGSRSCSFVSPTCRPADVSFRGQPVEQVIGVIPLLEHDCVPVFLDARELGCPLQLLMLPRVPTAVEQMLYLAGATRPNRRLSISGVDECEDKGGRYSLFPGALIVIGVEMGNQEVAVPTLYRDDEYRPEDGVGSRSVSCTLLPAGGQHSPPPDEGSSSTDSARDMWNLGSADDDVCPSHPSKDTSARGADLATCAQRLRQKCDMAVQLAEMPASVCDYVLQSADTLAPRHYPGAESPEGDASCEEGEESSGGELEPTISGNAAIRRVMLKLLSFQTQARWDSLFVEDGEQESAVVERLRIIHGALHFYELVIPRMQPLPTVIVAAKVPRWWRQAGLAAVFVVDQQRSDQVHVVVAGRDDAVESLLPTRGSQDEPRVDVYTHNGGDLHGQTLLAWDHGDLVIMQVAGGAVPELRSTATILSDPGIDVLAADMPSHEVVPPMRYLLLGPGDVQTVAVLRTGPTCPQINAATGIGTDALTLWVQREPFEGPAHQGVGTNRCIAYRRKDTVAEHVGPAVFIDPRAVGKPLCCRLMKAAALTVEDFGSSLEVVLPEGFRLRFRGGQPRIHPPESRLFEHRDTCVLWVEAIMPPGSVTADALSQAMHDEDGPDDTLSSDSPPGPARSRSPKRRNCGDTGFSGGGHVTGMMAMSRPLPTPCRGLRCLPTVSLEEDFTVLERSGMLNTLLGESRREQRNAHLSAVMCLVAERQALMADVHCRPDGRASVPVLHLAPLIPPPTFDLTRQQMPISCSMSDVCQLLAVPCFQLCYDVPTAVCLHAATSKALVGLYEAAECMGACSPDRCEIYTDGSFDGVGSAWAMVVVWFLREQPVLFGWAGARVCVDPNSAVWLGATQHGALEAEETALCFALLWTVLKKDRPQATMRVDCISAMHRTTGCWQHPEGDRLASTGRSLAHLAETIGLWRSCDVYHVKSHQGNAWNELADVLAKYCTDSGADWTLGVDLGSLTRGNVFQDMWLVVEAWKDPSMWPQQQDGFLVDTGVRCPGDIEDPGMFIRQPDCGPVAKCQSGKWSMLRVFSLNVQTLESTVDPHEGSDFPGRVQYLREQFSRCGAHIVGIQEARSCRTECVLSGSFIRLCSGKHSQGHLGVEGWFATRQSVGQCGFVASELTVTYWDPRILCVKVDSAHLQCLVVFLHAPTAQDGTREAWWQSLLRLVGRLRGGQDVLLVGDFNTRFSFPVHGRIGEHVWNSSYPVPEGLLELLRNSDLWVPSTFQDIQVGPHETWAAPGQQATARLDYIAAPTSWIAEPDSATVRMDIDPGHRSVDHYAISVDLWVRSSRCRGKVPGRNQFDRVAMTTPEGREKVKDICARIPLQPWHMDADSHYRKVQEFLAGELAEAFPMTRRGKPASLFSDATWVVKDHRVWLRKCTADQRRRARSPDLFASFRAWRKHGSLRASRCVTLAWICGEAHRAAGFVRQLRQTRQLLRQAIRSDRRDFVGRLAQDAMDSSVKDVLAKMKPLLRCAGRRKNGGRALPATQLEDGTLAVDPEQALDRWVRHFAGVEGGIRRDPAEVVEARWRRLLEGREPIEIRQNEVPSRISLERACQNVACGKAMGPDGVPGELVRHGSGQISRPVYQLLLKLALRGDEPTMFKGGTVYAAWKGRGAQAVCANHRGLLVSSVIGKTLHSTVRRKLMPVMCDMASPLQVGGLPRFPVAYAAHAARLFQSAFVRQNYVILFVDLKEAFYRLARPLLTSECPSDESYARLFATLQLPPSSFAAFRQAVEAGPAIAKHGASEWIQAVVTEMLQQTWFSLPGQRDTVETTLGSRPGDGLADVLFSLVFADVLAAIRGQLAEVPSLCVPWHEAMRGQVAATPAQGATPGIGFLDVSWMDDLAIMGACPTARSVPDTLASVAGVVVDTLLSRGMYPNFDRNKTEAIVGLRGAGAQLVRKELLSDIEPRLQISSTHWPQQRVRVVATYKHLGGILHHQGKLVHEVRARTTLAWHSFRKHKRAVFGQKCVRLPDKVVLLQSLVLSVLFYGSGTWGRLEEEPRRRLNRAYVGLGRALLRQHFSGDVLRLSEERVLAHLGLPGIECWIHFSRLSYLASFVSLDVKEMWALAHCESLWLEEVRHSLEWLWEQVDAGRRTESWCAAWHEWKVVMCQTPKKWKRLIRFARLSAARASILEEGWQQCRGTMVRGLLEVGAHAQALQDRAQCGPQVCAACQMLFGSKQAWAVHAFKVHGRVKSSRLLVDGTSCPACLKVFPTNVRLCNHVDHSWSCRNALKRQGFLCRPQPGIGSLLADKGDLFLGAPMQGYGPQLDVSTWRSRSAETEAGQMPEYACVWKALLATLDAPMLGGSVQEVLGRYQLALCTACLSWEDITAVCRAWVFHVSECLDEEHDIASAALHRAAACWMQEHVTPEWLCPDPRRGQDLLATFRQSVACLALLEFDDVCVASPEGVLCEGGCLVCDASVGDELGTCFKPVWMACLHELEDTSDWCTVLEGQVLRRASHLHVLCLWGCRIAEVVPCRPLKASVYKAHRLRSTMVQDTILLFCRLWRACIPVVIVVPDVDPAIYAVLKRLPGVCCVVEGNFVIAHNGPLDRIPISLFHICAN